MKKQTSHSSKLILTGNVKRVVVKIVNIQEEKNDAEKIAKNKTKKMVVIKNQSLYS
jgi:adenine-specific DNA glycosylase